MLPALLGLLGSVAGGIGAAAGGVAGAAGGAIGGIGGAVGGIGGFLGGGGAAAGGGGGGMFGAMNLAGMGMGLAQAFGKDATGASVMQKIPLSEEGKALQQTLEADTFKRLSGANLAEPYIKNYRSIQKGILKRQAGRAGDIGGQVGTQRVRTGRGLGGILAAAGSRVESSAAPDIWEAGFIRDEFTKGFAGLENIRNIDLQTGLLKAQSGYTKAALSQLKGAQQGQALGDFAEFLALQKYPYYPRY